MGIRLPVGLTYKRGGGGQSKSRLSHGQLPGQLRLSGKIFGWIGQPETPYFEHCIYYCLKTQKDTDKRQVMQFS